MEEKHHCKLCFKTFANGRALGGHMRSHFFYPKPPSPASSSSEDEYVENHQQHSDGYNLRKKSFRLGNSQISFAGDVTVAGNGGGGGAVVLQDGESETESSRNATVGRRRSKRIRKPVISWLDDHQRHFHQIDRYDYIKTRNQSRYLKKNSMIVNESSSVDLPDSVSSISDFSPEEDVAYCLMMLSRDKWIEEHQKPDENDSDSDSESERSKYRCNSCNKVFGSYQALGGHRASHKKIKFIHHNSNQNSQNVSIEDRIHECPVCLKVFASGQALGGHKRSHFTASSSAIAAVKPVTKQRTNLIDLNLPAPIEDDDVSQIEVSVVSDGEFVKRH